MNTLHNAEFCHKNKKIVKICLENVKGASQAMTREDGMRKRPGGVGGGFLKLGWGGWRRDDEGQSICAE